MKYHEEDRISPVQEMIEEEKSDRDLIEFYNEVFIKLKEAEEGLNTIKILARDSKVRSEDREIVKENIDKILNRVDEIKRINEFIYIRVGNMREHGDRAEKVFNVIRRVIEELNI